MLTVALVVYLSVTQWAGGVRSSHALPEYSDRTGESCGVCHVNAGGGGPRTLRGSLWAARGRPDEIPELPNVLLAPGVTDGMELYDIACAGCHGFRGEGLFALGLVDTGVSEAAIRSFIVRGIPPSGMPAFEGQFTSQQLEALVDFVTGLATGEIQLQNQYALPPAQFKCESIITNNACGGD